MILTARCEERLLYVYNWQETKTVPDYSYG